MASLVILLIVLVAIIAWGFSRTEYVRQRMWHQFGVQLLVSVYGFGLAALGYWVGGGRPLLGLVALSPGSVLIWIPIIGFLSVIVFWPYLGHLLASTRLASHPFWFFVLILLHYAGAIVFIVQDLQRSGPSQEITAIWKHNPVGLVLFGIAYLLGQLVMWGYLIRQVPVRFSLRTAFVVWTVLAVCAAVVAARHQTSMSVVAGGLVIVLMTAGLVLGCVIPIRFCGHIRGFVSGMFFGGIVSLLGALMAGNLVGGLGEEFLGTGVGVPLGLFVGCSAGMCLSNCFMGSIGALASRMFRA